MIGNGASAQGVSYTPSVMASNASASKKGTVYVVDDERPVASLLESLLLDAGYEVFVSYGSEEALEELRSFEGGIDLFIIDVVLPAISGPDLAQELEEMFPGSAILFTSGYGQGAGAALRRRNPDASFLAKPFVIDEVGAAVAEAIESRRAAAG